MTETGLLSLEEVVARVQMSARNVRFYTSRGLVPPPLRRGRQAYYSADHVARLELVRELQAHGFTLGSIEQYLGGLPDDASAGDLALLRTMLAPWHRDRPVRMSAAELDERAGRPLAAADRELLVELRIAEPRPDGDYDVSPTQLSVGLGLLEIGFPPEAAQAAAAVFTRHGREIAAELHEVFRTLAWPAYREAGLSREQVPDVLERIKPLSIASLIVAYEQGMEEASPER